MDPKTLIPLFAQGSLWLVVLSFGLRADAARVFEAMRHSGLILKGILAVYIVVPALAVIICTIMPIDRTIAIGIVLMAVSPLAPVIPARFMQAGLDPAKAVHYYVTMILFAVFFVPATVALLSALYPPNASISVGAVSKLVALTILAPIGIGVAIATLAPRIADYVAPVTFWTGLIAAVLLVTAILYKQGGAIVGLIGDGTLVVIVLIVLAGILAGHLLGRPSPLHSNVLAVSAAIRHPGIAALIVRDNFTEPRVMLTVILFLLTSFVVTALYGVWFKRAYPSSPVVLSAAWHSPKNAEDLPHN
ncbi:hypothetical protein GCM10022276_28350 [Sphingomonas limnosediminicola]|uniref:Na+-dependent transporter n=1 Tax=Sphingomonas limnosediminicola TaxID=940133 RepID=A0ABP7LTH2_9SPHN